MNKILVVDDERNVHYSFRRVLGSEYEIISAFSGEEALQKVTDPTVRLILMDVRMPGKDGLATLQEVKRLRPELPVIIMTAFVSAETAIRATTFNAEDYLEKPFDVAGLKRLIVETLQRHRSSAAAEKSSPGAPESPDMGAVPLLGQSKAMQEVYKIIGKSAARDVTVLLTGESGTGKELVARALHAYSKRASNPFLALNCAAIPETLLESELFGYERGAFSGATEARPGQFELAHGGTVFLDEIGDMPLILQSKLLRVLQEREISRLGSRESRQVNVRIIAATNQGLEDLIRTGRFREDLYYRLNVVRISLPPLRARGEDMMLLAEHFLRVHGRGSMQRAPGFSADAREKLRSHTWPGNVRELENVIAQAVLHVRGPVLTAADLVLSEPISRPAQETPASESGAVPSGSLETLFSQHAGNVFAVAEQRLVAKALELARYNQVQAARLLGISRNVLRDRMKRYRL